MQIAVLRFIKNQIATVACPTLWWFGRPLCGQYRQLSGHSWFAAWPDQARREPRRAILAEDGNCLAGAESALGVIQNLGFGAYRYTENGIIFSTSDNSDPNRNGRKYRIVHNPRNVFRTSVAVNSHPENVTDSQVEQKVDYALSVLPVIKMYERISGTTLNQKNVLEVGPGPDYAWTMVMACLGAQCHVVDPFVPVWSDSYHPRFFRSLAKRLQSLPRFQTVDPIEQLINAGGFNHSDVITRYNVALEELDAPSNSFDLVLSAAVGEHLYDIEGAFGRLVRATAVGGYEIHIIDLRDHRDFSKPLEHLLLSEKDYSKEFVMRHGECGNRHRSTDFLSVFNRLGMQMISCESTSQIDAKYLEEFIPRLRMCDNSRYRMHEISDLQTAGMSVVFRKCVPNS